MLNKIKRVLWNERGTQFLEGGLWIVLVVFVLAIAGAGVAGVAAGKFNGLRDALDAVSVPTLSA